LSNPANRQTDRQRTRPKTFTSSFVGGNKKVKHQKLKQYTRLKALGLYVLYAIITQL